MNKNKLLFQAIATMVGTVIGAGILGLPYVVAKAGFLVGILNIVVIGVIVLLLYLYLGETVLRTKGFHQLTGYAEIYLGKTGKRLMTFAMVFGTYGALIAYVIGEGQVLSAIFGGNPLIYSLIFFVIAAAIVYYGLKSVAESELYMVPIVLLIVAAVIIFAFKFINVNNFSASFDAYNLFLPYGVVLFAFLGAAVIPEMEQELVKNEKLMKKAIIAGMMIPMITYLLFAVFAVGVTGVSTTEVATVGLGELIGEHMVLIGNIFAAFAMATSFLTLGLALKQMYNYDYGLNDRLSWALTVIIPLIVALSGLTTFIKIIGLSGVVSGGVEGVLIVLMAMKAKRLGNRKPEFTVPMNWLVALLIIAMFVFGAGYYFLSSL